MLRGIKRNELEAGYRLATNYLGSIALILAADFSFAFTMSGVDGVPLFSFPYKGYVLPTLAVGVVLLILGVILMAVPLITEKRSHFSPPLPP